MNYEIWQHGYHGNNTSEVVDFDDGEYCQRVIERKVMEGKKREDFSLVPDPDYRNGY